MKMEAVCLCETFVPTYISKQCRSPEHRSVQNLKIFLFYIFHEMFLAS